MRPPCSDEPVMEPPADLGLTSVIDEAERPNQRLAIDGDDLLGHGISDPGQPKLAIQPYVVGPTAWDGRARQHGDQLLKDLQGVRTGDHDRGPAPVLFPAAAHPEVDPPHGTWPDIRVHGERIEHSVPANPAPPPHSPRVRGAASHVEPPPVAHGEGVPRSPPR